MQRPGFLAALAASALAPSGIDLALHVVERFHGAQHANDVAGYMEFARTQRPAPESRA